MLTKSAKKRVHYSYDKQPARITNWESQLHLMTMNDTHNNLNVCHIIFTKSTSN